MINRNDNKRHEMELNWMQQLAVYNINDNYEFSFNQLPPNAF